MAIAGTTTQNSGQLHLPQVYYNAYGLDQLVPKFRFYQAAEKFPQPQGVGKTQQMWRDAVPGYNTNPASEGVALSSPFVNPTTTTSVTVEAFSDFMSTSTMIEDISNVNEGQRLIRALSIRGAGTVDTIIRSEADTNTTNSTDVIDTSNHRLATNDFKKVVKLLEGLNVDPFDGLGGNWLSIAHPYVLYDVVSDTTAGQFVDIVKYSQPDKALSGEVGMISKVRILTSTNVNTSDSSTTTKYHCYIFGYQGLGVTELEGRGAGGIVDPKRENFKINVYKGGGPWDPTGEIGSVAGYRFVMAAKMLDYQRFYILKPDPSIA